MYRYYGSYIYKDTRSLVKHPQQVFNYRDMKLSALNSNKPSCYYDKTSADLIQCTIFKSPEKYSHAS